MIGSATAGRNRVVITGLGVISSIGVGTARFLAGLQAGHNGARPITAFDTTGFPHTFGCEVADFAIADWVRHSHEREVGRAGQFAASAARMAVTDAGIDDQELIAARTLVAVGTTDGESRDLDRLTELYLDGEQGGEAAGLAERVPAGRLASAVAAEFQLVDVEAVTVATACAAGNYSIGYGIDALRAGDADIALCGGADALCRKMFAGFYRLGTIAPQRCQPFDRDRRGLLTGEGAAILVLESLDRALARGARIYAELLGYGLNCDAHHAVAPHRESLAECIRLAHGDSGIRPADVDLISAHGTGTAANDITEVGAIKSVFGPSPPPTVALKSMLGHAMGAASALATAACALSITEGFLPPTINYETPDPECAIDCVANVARTAQPRIVQNNALAVGGNNAVLVLGRYPMDAA